MKSTVKERLIDFITYLGISKREFEGRCGLSSRYVSNISVSVGADKLRTISAIFPELNTEWLLTGEGEMLKSTPPPFISSTLPAPVVGDLLLPEDMRKPVLPAEVAYRPDINIYDYIRANAAKLERSRVIVLDLPIDMWHTVRDDSLLPDAKRGDTIALSAYPKGMEDPIPGALHAVDTLSNGIIVRKLLRTEDGYRAIAPNREIYPDMIIPDKNIITIFRIVFLGRVSL